METAKLIVFGVLATQLSIAYPAFGADPIFPVCSHTVRHLLDRWEPHRDWRLVTQTMNQPKIFQTPTSQIGEWLEARISPDGKNVQLTKMTPTQRTVASFPPGCVAHIRNTVLHYNQERMRRSFSDDTLRGIVATHRAGIIYSWSPHMPLSIERVRSIQKASRALNLPVFYVLDPHADRTRARAVAREHGLDEAALRPMESIELFNRGMLIHFPSVVVFSDRKIVGRTVPGWKHDDAYVTLVREQLAMHR